VARRNNASFFDVFFDIFSFAKDGEQAELKQKISSEGFPQGDFRRGIRKPEMNRRKST